MKKVIIIVAAVAVFIGAAAGAYFFGARKGGGAAAEKPKEEKVAASFNIGEITTNLADTGIKRYILVDVSLGVASEETAKHMEKESAAVKDAIISVLRSKTYEQLGGEAGMLLLKKELQMRVNKTLGSEEIKEVFFNKFVVE